MKENNNQVAEKRECENRGATHGIGENTLCDDMVTIPRAEYERLKSEMKGNNPFCSSCKEADCLVSNDDTCAYIRTHEQLLKFLK